LDEATRLFAERGYEGTSMADLAERVGLRKASLFHHFASKEELRRAVLERLVTRFAQVISETLASSPSSADFALRLDSLTDAMIGIMQEQPYAARLLLREAMEWGPNDGGALGDALASSLELGEKFLLAGQQTSTVRAGDAKHMVASVMAIHLLPFAIGGVMERFTGGSPWTESFIAARREAVKAHLRALLLRP
jgi:AcrR family transcriptional regulator